MKPPDLLQNLAIIPLGQVCVDELANKELHWRSLFLLNGRPLRRVNVVHGIVNQHPFRLSDVLNRFLALQRLEEAGHSWGGIRILEQISAAVFDQIAEDLDVHPRKVVEANLQAVEHNVLRHSAKLGKLCQISDIA